MRKKSCINAYSGCHSLQLSHWIETGCLGRIRDQVISPSRLSFGIDRPVTFVFLSFFHRLNVSTRLVNQCYQQGFDPPSARTQNLPFRTKRDNWLYTYKCCVSFKAVPTGSNVRHEGNCWEPIIGCKELLFFVRSISLTESIMQKGPVQENPS